MPVITPTKIAALHQNPENIRNICILAHVDHGKTSLSDCLIATNGIISPRSAGKVRYLDSRPDEQTRGITMVSSAISLLYSVARRKSPDLPLETQDYLINLVDSPGHVDFSSEVSTASRLCDGALVLVDAIEGVCSQTITVLRQTWLDHLKPILVINKIDRLITEYRMTPFEAYTRLSQILETVNAVMGSFFQGERMENDLKWRQTVEQRLAAKADRRSQSTAGDLASGTAADEDEVQESELFEEKDDEELYFGPERNNVIFASAIDGWAFTVRQFAGIYERKLGMKKEKLERVLWGDYYYDPKSKRVLSSKHLKGRHLKPMFSQLILENIWAIYRATGTAPETQRDDSMIDKITKALSISLPAQVLRSKEPRVVLTSMFSNWLPLSTAILVSVIEYLPAPFISQHGRMPKMIDASPGGSSISPEIRTALINPSAKTARPVVAYVSKMVAIPERDLPRSGQDIEILTPEQRQQQVRRKRAEVAKLQATDAAARSEEPPDPPADKLAKVSLNGDETSVGAVESVAREPEHLIGFARLFCGTLSVGDEIYVVPPKYNASLPSNTTLTKVVVKNLYLLMGRSLEILQTVAAGSIFGIEGLEGEIFKSGTLCSQAEGVINLAGVVMGSRPILRVALEPHNPGDLDSMISGLKLLEQSDPCAEYEVLDNGEHAILTAGELHLERCLKDLQERFAGVEIDVGEAIVPYRETIVASEEIPSGSNSKEARGSAREDSAAAGLTFDIRVIPIPSSITALLDSSVSAMRNLIVQAHGSDNPMEQEATRNEHPAPSDDKEEEDRTGRDTINSLITSAEDFEQALSNVIKELEADSDIWAALLPNIVSFGPRRTGPNLLIDKSGNSLFRPLFGKTDPKLGSSSERSTQLADRVIQAFQVASLRGPLCAEPMQGVAVLIEKLERKMSSIDTLGSSGDIQTHQVSEILKTIQHSIHRGFLDWSPRIMLAMYSCEIASSTEVLGRVYSVLTRRRGRILSEAMREGTPFFTIEALIPVVESFGFSEEIRKKTSGAAAPQLVFWGYDMINEDPFWVPRSEEELEDLGEKGDKENVAKRYVDMVRTRKGMVVKGRKVVEHGEKQKTLKR